MSEIYSAAVPERQVSDGRHLVTGATSPPHAAIPAGGTPGHGTMVHVADAFHLAGAHGWWRGHLEFDALRRHAHTLGLIEAPNRPGATGRDLLRPTRPHDAHPRSLSARYGLNAQPLHTDGAHHRQPPRFVVLSATAPSATATLLWQPPATPDWNALLQHGLFTVSSGPTRFLSTACTSHRLRYDPGCMTAADTPARHLQARLAAASADAIEHRWTDPDTVLVIDNWRTLHARAAVTNLSEPRVMRRIAYHEGATG